MFYPHDFKTCTKAVGFLQQFEKAMSDTIAGVGMQNVPFSCNIKMRILKNRRKQKQAKDRALKEKHMKAEEKYVEALCYHWMYNSDEC